MIHGRVKAKKMAASKVKVDIKVWAQGEKRTKNVNVKGKWWVNKWKD